MRFPDSHAIRTSQPSIFHRNRNRIQPHYEVKCPWRMLSAPSSFFAARVVVLLVVMTYGEVLWWRRYPVSLLWWSSSMAQFHGYIWWSNPVVQLNGPAQCILWWSSSVAQRMVSLMGHRLVARQLWPPSWITYGLRAKEQAKLRTIFPFWCTCKIAVSNSPHKWELTISVLIF